MGKIGTRRIKLRDQKYPGDLIQDHPVLPPSSMKSKPTKSGLDLSFDQANTWTLEGIQRFVAKDPSVVSETRFLELLARNNKFEAFKWVINHQYVRCDPKLLNTQRTPKVQKILKKIGDYDRNQRKLQRQDPWNIGEKLPTFAGKIPEFLQACLTDDIDIRFLLEIVKRYKELGFLNSATKTRIISIAFSGKITKAPIGRLSFLASQGIEIIVDPKNYIDISPGIMPVEKIDFFARHAIQNSLLLEILMNPKKSNFDIPRLFRKNRPGYFNDHFVIKSIVRTVIARCESGKEQSPDVKKILFSCGFSRKFWIENPKFSEEFMDSLSKLPRKKCYANEIIPELFKIGLSLECHLYGLFGNMEKQNNSLQKNPSYPRTTFDYNLKILESIRSSFWWENLPGPQISRSSLVSVIQVHACYLYEEIHRIKYQPQTLPWLPRTKSGEILIRDPLFRLLCSLPISLVQKILGLLFTADCTDALARFKRFVQETN